MPGVKERIRTRSYEVGFQRCRFARVEPPPHGDFVRRWLAAGHAAGMSYIERGLPKRLDPRLIVPEVRTVITVGYRYVPPPLPPTDWQQQLRGRIAAYALGTDYHVTVAHKLGELAAYVARLHEGAVAVPYVDTGAILEREWAARAGVGWFGKNTNILHPQDGSYFFLGELLTNVEIEPDPPLPDHCGTCTRCLELCPTGALKPGYVLDARLCISYWTIEHRGTIPLDIRSKLGNWIFGCDICQEVCPWNERLARDTGAPHTAELLPYLPDLLSLDESRFHRRFAHSALRRAKRDGLLRNVTIALGNSLNPAAVPWLAASLRGDASALIRAHAAWALGNIGGRSVRVVLDTARRGESDAAVQAEIDAALGATS
jgi:epoxyqueuosine reductase